MASWQYWIFIWIFFYIFQQSFKMFSMKSCTSCSYVYLFAKVIVSFKVTFSFYCKYIEYIYKYIEIQVYKYMCVYVCVYVCICVCCSFVQKHFSAIFISVISLQIILEFSMEKSCQLSLLTVLFLLNPYTFIFSYL